MGHDPQPKRGGFGTHLFKVPGLQVDSTSVASLIDVPHVPPQGLDFVIDDLAGGDSWGPDDAVGMTWCLSFATFGSRPGLGAEHP